MRQFLSLEGAADVYMFGVGEEEERFDGGILQAIDGCYGLLVFKVFRGADAANDDLRAQLVAEVDGHAGIGGYFHSGTVAQHLADARHAFLHGEHVFFFGIDSHGDHHFVEQRQHAPKDGFVAVGEGVERPGEKS